MTEHVNGIGKGPGAKLFFDKDLERLKGTGNSEKSREVFQATMSILDSFLKVTTPGDLKGMPGSVPGATGAPEIDEPGSMTNRQGYLEMLVAYMTLDNSELQQKQLNERLEVNKKVNDKVHDDKRKKLENSLKEMDEAARSRTANRILGILGAIFAVVVAVVSGGALAIAGAAIAVGLCLLNETGAVKAISKAISKKLQAGGMRKREADKRVTIGMGVFMMALGLAGGVMSASAGLQGAGAVKEILGVVGVLMTGGGLLAGAASTQLGFGSQMSQAELVEFQKYIAAQKQVMDELQEEFNELLQLLENGIQRLTALLSSELDTEKFIADKLMRMA